VRIAVRIPPDYASKSYGEIQSAALIEKEEWQKDGSWICVVRIPAGIQGEFYDLINRVTKGQGEVRILNQVY
jgi:ribosome maturation protein SDO1